MRGSRRDTACSGDTPPKRPYTAHKPRNGAGLGFARPYGKAYGLFASLMENHMVRHRRAKTGGVLRIAQPPMAVPGGPPSRRCVPMAVLAERLVITDCLEKRDPTAGCVRRSLCVQNRGVFSTASPKAVRKTHRRWGGLVKPMGVAGAVRLCQTNCRSPGHT